MNEDSCYDYDGGNDDGHVIICTQDQAREMPLDQLDALFHSVK